MLLKKKQSLRIWAFFSPVFASQIRVIFTSLLTLFIYAPLIGPLDIKATGFTCGKNQDPHFQVDQSSEVQTIWIDGCWSYGLAHNGNVKVSSVSNRPKQLPYSSNDSLPHSLPPHGKKRSWPRIKATFLHYISVVMFTSINDDSSLM